MGSIFAVRIYGFSTAVWADFFISFQGPSSLVPMGIFRIPVRINPCSWVVFFSEIQWVGFWGRHKSARIGFPVDTDAGVEKRKPALIEAGFHREFIRYCRCLTGH